MHTAAEKLSMPKEVYARLKGWLYVAMKDSTGPIANPFDRS